MVALIKLESVAAASARKPSISANGVTMLPDATLNASYPAYKSGNFSK
ncbi:hypothetical protein H5C53_013885 [Escherichia coli]|nr:hypothetical protein [Escherichia coli]MCB6152945.1 hypothetical protein [Escherichia coli]